MALFSEIKDIVGGRLFTKDARDVDLNSAESIKEEISRLKDILDDTATGTQAFQIDKKIKDLEDKLKQLTKDADFENIFQGIMRFAGLDAAKFSAEEAKDIGERAGVDFGEVDFNEFRLGLEVELEHADLTDGDPNMTAKIALAHLKEIPDYYTRLTKMENDAKTEDADGTKGGSLYTSDGGPGSGIKGHKTYHAEGKHEKQTTGQGSIAKYAHLKNPGAAMSRVRRKLEGLYGEGVAPNFHAEVTSLRKKYPGAKFSQNLLREMVSQGFKVKERPSTLLIETPYWNYVVKKATKDGGPGSGIKGHVTNRAEATPSHYEKGGQIYFKNARHVASFHGIDLFDVGNNVFISTDPDGKKKVWKGYEGHEDVKRALMKQIKESRENFFKKHYK